MGSDFRLVDSRWDRALQEAASGTSGEILVISPFIKIKAAERLFDAVPTFGSCRVITRFNLDDFAACVSDLDAIRFLVAQGSRIRGIRNLHAKLFVFGGKRAVVTSANLTMAALRRNHELGFASSEAHVVQQCRRYFENLWKKAGSDVTLDDLEEWTPLVTEHQRRATQSNRTLGDRGTDVSLPPVPASRFEAQRNAEQAFVKFLGKGDDRAPRERTVLNEVKGSGCHRVCCYPKNKRPRAPRNGCLMFMGRLVDSPNDILVFGRAVGMKHDDRRDDATSEDIARRAWREAWPHYVRVREPEFIDGRLQDGVSLTEMMEALGADAFSSTQQNAAMGHGNTNPRLAYRQQPAVELTPEGADWLNARLDSVLQGKGRVGAATLNGIP